MTPLCRCGCGERTRLARHQFIHGHRARLSRRQGPDYVVDPETGCWEWQHAKARGYGRTVEHGQDWLAYKLYSERVYGPIPDGWDLDHLCRNPGCVNPDHLEPVTHAENCRRGGKAKLTWDDVFAIRASSESYSKLAESFDVSTCAISNIKNRKRWVEDEFTPGRAVA